MRMGKDVLREWRRVVSFISSDSERVSPRVIENDSPYGTAARSISQRSWKAETRLALIEFLMKNNM